MKKLLFLLILLSSITGFSQVDCFGPIERVKSPKGEINSREAGKRVNLYKTQKNKNKRHLDSIFYHPCGFLDLLEKITGKGYSGLRIYIGADTSDNNKLMLLFVPTFNVNSDGYRFHQDDLGYCYRIVDKKAENVYAENASNYVKAYLRNQHIEFTSEGHTYTNATMQNPFIETISLWYDISLIERGIDPADNRTGLVTYLQQLINIKNIDGVVVDFGAFDDTVVPVEYYFHLTPSFRFHNENGDEIILLSTPLSEEEKKLREFIARKFASIRSTPDKFYEILDNFSYVDTGVPCPPPPSGHNSCFGSQLPLP